jgi:hypothetical protein
VEDEPGMDICPSLERRERTEDVLDVGEGGSGTEDQVIERRGRKGAKRRNWMACERGGDRETVGSVCTRTIAGARRLRASISSEDDKNCDTYGSNCSPHASLSESLDVV